MACRIKDPFKGMEKEGFARVQGNIPEELFTSLFKERLPVHGSQSRIIGRFLVALDKHLDQQGVPTHYSNNNEQQVERILQNVERFLEGRGNPASEITKV